MFDATFFVDIRDIVDDLFDGAEKVYVQRQKVYDQASNSMVDKSPVGAAVEAVVTQVSESLVDNERILKTDAGIVMSAARIAFKPEAGDIVFLGDDATAEESFTVLAVGITRSVTVKMLYELVVRL